MNQILVDDKWIGIPFEWNVNDCATISTGFLKENNIEIKLPEYDKDWKEADPQLVIKTILKQGKVIDKIEDLQPLDIVCFRGLGVRVGHVGVYLGYGKFLHIFKDKKSGIDRLTGSVWGKLYYCGVRPTELTGNDDKNLHIPDDEKVGDPITLAVAAITTMVGAAAAAGGIAAVTFFGLTGMAAVFAWGALGAVLAGLGSMLAPKPKGMDVASSVGRYGFGPLQNTASSEIPVAFSYGGLKLAGNAIYQSDPAETVYRCDCFGEGVCHSISDIRVNDIPIGDLTGCSSTWYSGDSTQNVDARFSAKVPGLRYLAYLALTLQTSDELKGGFPAITAIIQGLKVKTYSGGSWSGSTYSNNPSACIRDFLTNTRYGIGMPESIIDGTTFGEVYDNCAVMVDDNEGGTEARYTLNYVIDQKRPALDILRDMLSVFGGVLVWSGTTLRLKMEKSDTPVQNFDMDTIREGSFSYKYIPKDENANRVKVQYIDPDQNYTKVYTVAEDTIDQDRRASIEGGNGIVEKEMSLLGVTDMSRATRLANLALRKIKTSKLAVTFMAGIKAIHCEPFDVITVSHDVPNWTNKKFRVYQIKEADNDEMEIIALEYDNTIYDDSYSCGVVVYDYGSPTNPYAPLPNVTSLSVVESKYVNKDGVFVSDLDVSWTGITSGNELFLDYIVKLKKGGGGYETVGRTIDTDFTIPNVEAATAYYVKVHTASTEGYVSTGTTSSLVTAGGKISSAGDVTGFANTFTDEIKLSWNPLPSGDLWGYEIRDNDAGWGSGDAHLIWRGDATTFTIVRPSSRTPGAHYVKALDNSGNYSTTAASTTPTNAAPTTPTLSGTDFFDVCKLNWADVGDKDLLFYEVWRSTNNAWSGEETREKKVTAGNFSGGISTIVNGPAVSGDTYYWKAMGVDTYGSGDMSTAYTNSFVGVASGDIINEAIHARHLTTVELITLTAQIKDAIINSAKIISLSADKITTGSLLGQIITGGTIQTGSSGARFVITSGDLIGYDDSANVIFKVTLSGDTLGDVQMGDYAGGNGILWDDSAGKFIIKGVLDIGTAGKVYIDGTNEIIKVYDASNNLRVELGKFT